MEPAQALIVGAGPTGLVLALCLASHGIPFRIIDKSPDGGLFSRAMVVHARTLEFYAQLGFADEMISKGIRMNSIHIREHGKDLGEILLNDIGMAISPYPFALCFPQDDHEKFLGGKLAALNIYVEWNTELVAFAQSGDKVQCTLKKHDSAEMLTVNYVCGCDGARSTVRKALNIDFPGGTYEQMFFVADAKVKGDIQTNVLGNLGPNALALQLPVRSSGMQRLIGIIPPALADKPDLTFTDIKPEIEPLMGIDVEDVNWFATYHVHHRVAAQFRVGHIFLCGDAGHIHSPAGGQGMNTGIGDAINLSWKLAEVLKGRAGEKLLNSYSEERMAFAHQLINQTDRAFRAAIDPGWKGRFLRTQVVNRVVPILSRLRAVRYRMFMTVSQLGITYRSSSGISSGKAGDIHGGDRLPWTGTNYAPLSQWSWRAQVYGTASPEIKTEVTELSLPLDVLPWNETAAEAGFKENALYLIRPDGYVALATEHPSAGEIRAYFKSL